MLRILDDIGTVTEERVGEMIERLPAWRREKALRYKFLQGRWECAASYLLLCEILRDEYGVEEQVEFVEGEHGKPSLKGHEDIYFNMSHCKCGVAVVVDDVPVGIDIERIGRENDALARHVLSEEEYGAMMAAENPSVEFTKFWTKKEALVKLTGTGITDDLKTLLSNAKNVKIETTVNEEKGYVYSVARHKCI